MTTLNGEAQLDLLDDIREGFANLQPDSICPLHALPEMFPGWVYRDGDAYGVAIEVPPRDPISARFSGARLRTVLRHDILQLRLECCRTALRNEFAVLGAQFLTPGDGGTARIALTADPLAWWRQWTLLLGNSIRAPQAYSVLGELLAYERLLARGDSPSWVGPYGSSQDIETPTASYEVKSTVSRYGSVVRISSQFQIRQVGKPLFIVHQRLEPSSDGDSVQSVIARLRQTDVLLDDAENLLAQLGLEEGAEARLATYKLLESSLYPVDEMFPGITLNSFVGGVMPTGVVALEYDVELTGLPRFAF